MEKLSKERMGEIAVLFMKHRVRQSTHLDGNRIRREAGTLSKELGISQNETLAFIETITREVVEEAFSRSLTK